MKNSYKKQWRWKNSELFFALEDHSLSESSKTGDVSFISQIKSMFVDKKQDKGN